MPETWTVVVFIVGTVAVVFAAYYFTYLLGKRSFKAGAGRNIRLRDNFAVSKDKSFCLIEVKGKVYLVAMSSNSITLLDTLSAEQFAEDDSIRAGVNPFTAGAVQKGIVKGFSYIRENWPRGSDTVTDDPGERATLQRAEEEDNLDRVYRELQAKMARRRAESSREDEE